MGRTSAPEWDCHSVRQACRQSVRFSHEIFSSRCRSLDFTTDQGSSIKPSLSFNPLHLSSSTVCWWFLSPTDHVHQQTPTTFYSCRAWPHRFMCSVCVFSVISVAAHCVHVAKTTASGWQRKQSLLFTTHIPLQKQPSTFPLFLFNAFA